LSRERRSWLREPLLHFLLLGAGLFALNTMLRERRIEAGAADGGEIVVSPGRIENLIALYTKTWQRAPTPDEMRGLIQDHVLEEALYREGLALGLDRNDIVIRRRLRQKMEFVVEDIVELAEPTDADLEAWLTDHPESYAEPGQYSFRQVYLNPENHGDAIRQEGERLLAELRTKAVEDARELGDATLLAHANGDMQADEVARTFGQGFAEDLAQLATGEWSGPIESAYGLHLVLVDVRQAGRVSELAEVRGAVERDWRFARREEAQELFNANLLERYRVTIEWPEDLVEAAE
jgi:hypothetical protein